MSSPFVAPKPIAVKTPSGYRWNSASGLFESVLYVPDPAQRSIITLHTREPEVFFADLFYMGKAFETYANGPDDSNVVKFPGEDDWPTGILTL